MRQLKENDKFSIDSSGRPFITPADLRSLLSMWTQSIASAFAKMNGLRGLEQADKEQHLAEALFISMAKARRVPSARWRTLAQEFGLLTDNAFWVSDEVYREHQQYFHVVEVEGTKRYVFFKAKGRFAATPAHVALYLTRLGCVSGTGAIPSIHWRLFESCTSEYMKLCWSLNLPRPCPATYKYTPIIRNRRGRQFTVSFPATAFQLPRQLTTVHRGVLPDGLYKCNVRSNFGGDVDDEAATQCKIDAMKKGAAKEKEELASWFRRQSTQWRKMMLTDNAGIILENCGATSFADIIGMTAGKLFLVQNKYYFNAKLDGRGTESAFTVMENDRETIEFLIDCCCNVDPATKNKIPVNVVSVLVVAKAESVDPSIDLGMKKSQLPKAIRDIELLGAFKRRLVVAFPSMANLTQEDGDDDDDEEANVKEQDEETALDEDAASPNDATTKNQAAGENTPVFYRSRQIRSARFSRFFSFLSRASTTKVRVLPSWRNSMRDIWTARNVATPRKFRRKLSPQTG